MVSYMMCEGHGSCLVLSSTHLGFHLMISWWIQFQPSGPLLVSRKRRRASRGHDTSQGHNPKVTHVTCPCLNLVPWLRLVFFLNNFFLVTPCWKRVCWKAGKEFGGAALRSAKTWEIQLLRKMERWIWGQMAIPTTWSFCNDRYNGQNIKEVLRDHLVKHSNSIDESQRGLVQIHTRQC